MVFYFSIVAHSFNGAKNVKSTDRPATRSTHNQQPQETRAISIATVLVRLYLPNYRRIYPIEFMRRAAVVDRCMETAVCDRCLTFSY